MKFYVVGLLAVLSGAQAAESISTVTCSGCPPTSSTVDIVTRSALPSTSCTEQPLVVVTNGTETSTILSGTAQSTASNPASTPSSTVVPVSGASGSKMGSVGGVLVVAAVVAGHMM